MNKDLYFNDASENIKNSDSVFFNRLSDIMLSRCVGKSLVCIYNINEMQRSKRMFDQLRELGISYQIIKPYQKSFTKKFDKFNEFNNNDTWFEGNDVVCLISSSDVPLLKVLLEIYDPMTFTHPDDAEFITLIFNP